MLRLRSLIRYQKQKILPVEYRVVSPSRPCQFQSGSDNRTSHEPLLHPFLLKTEHSELVQIKYIFMEVSE